MSNQPSADQTQNTQTATKKELEEAAVRVELLVTKLTKLYMSLRKANQIARKINLKIDKLSMELDMAFSDKWDKNV